jgi:hypothetical protein
MMAGLREEGEDWTATTPRTSDDEDSGEEHIKGA